MSSKNKSVNLTSDSSSIELDIKDASVGPSVIDLKNLYKETGLFTLDPSYSTTASCVSHVTYIDGNEGILEYRGYPIEQLAAKSTYLEVAYLLFNGELPSVNSLQEFRSQVKANMILPEQTKTLFQGFDESAHPMAMLTTSIASLSSLYHEGIDVKNSKHQKEFFFNVLGKTPILVANIFNHRNQTNMGQYDESLTYAENILRLFFGGDTNYEINPVFAKALDILLVLHADHEQNCSTSTCRMVASGGANPFASVSAAIGALWGPLHGGANMAVIKMLKEIHSSGDDGSRFVEDARNGKARLMGFGHRVYKNYDPRAKILNVSCNKALESLGVASPTLDIARHLEEVALNDDYFIERKLYPNVDFYSGILLEAIGFPLNMFTVIFAIGRLAGWLSHWKEIAESGGKIHRPRQVYQGATTRDYLPIEGR